MIVSVQLRNGVDTPQSIPPGVWTTIKGYGRVNGDYLPSWLTRMEHGEIWPGPTSCDLMTEIKLDWPAMAALGATHIGIRLARDPNAIFRDPATPVNTTACHRHDVSPYKDPTLTDWITKSYLLTGRHTEPLAAQVWHDADGPVPLLGAEFKARVIPSWP